MRQRRKRRRMPLLLGPLRIPILAGGFVPTTSSGKTFGGGGGSTIRACLEVSANQTAVIGSNGILIARSSGNKNLVAVYSLQVCPQQLS